MTVIKLDDHRKPKPTVVHNDRRITVLRSEYVVRRTSWEGNKNGGWFSVRDAHDSMLFVRAGDLPDKQIADLVMAWLDGRAVGRKQVLAAKCYTGDIV
ncbi:hypothetical protein BSZ19_18550 [Bradyrhizobium japonicum]|uniref:Uncharacterized protein n=1 Tax=Bradyrhizobium japonicum TaxID=375 RepID=A0A1Y2JNV5_BRAJP|nr:hypothetical protein [Bradyrhizobium japonicum]OSJ32552.1 hypothetical protein BSZ19_18550 [Bradyrhizobium japonicum]